MTPTIHKANSAGRALCEGTNQNTSELVTEVTCKLCRKKVEVLAEKTIKQLQDKVDWVHGNRMPSCADIADLLGFKGIPYKLEPSEGRHAKGKRYKGWKLTVGGLVLDTGERGYNEKNWGYAKQLLETIEEVPKALASLGVVRK